LRVSVEVEEVCRRADILGFLEETDDEDEEMTRLVEAPVGGVLERVEAREGLGATAALVVDGFDEIEEVLPAGGGGGCEMTFEMPLARTNKP
jgi:hypothetical protein